MNMKTAGLKFGDKKFLIYALMALIIGAFLSLLIMNIGYPSPNGGVFPDHPDRAFHMDIGWRISQGQIPYRDFSTVFGPAWILLSSIPIVLLGPNYAIALPAGVVMGFLAISLYAYFLLSIRGHPIVGIIGVMYIGKIFLQSPFLDYNEIGTIFLGLLIFELATVSEKSWRNFGWISGILIALLLFWKINFFVLAVITTLLLGIVFPKNNKWWWSFAFGFLLTTLAITLFIKGDLISMIDNLAVPFTIKSSTTINNLLDYKNHIKSITLFQYELATSALLLIITWKGAGARYKKLGETSVFGFIFFLYLLILQNTLNISNASTWAAHALPWAVILALLWLHNDINSKFSMKIGTIKNPLNRLGIIVMSLVIISVFWWPTFINAFKKKEAFSALRATDVSSIEEMNYWGSIKNGQELLKKNNLADKKITTMEYSNPFPPLLKNQSVKDDLIWWSIYDTFNENTHPDIAELLMNSEVVMQPKWHLDAYRLTQYETKWKLFEPLVTEEFSLIDESDYWRVWYTAKK